MPSAMLNPDPQIAVERISKAKLSPEESKRQLDALNHNESPLEKFLRAILFAMFPSLRQRL
jgi:hypothetical protein